MNVSDIRFPSSQHPNPKKPVKPGSGFENELKGVSSAPAQKNQELLETKDQPAVLTNSEKEYFQQLFPQSEEVRTYNPYRRDLPQTSVRLGSIVDRKG